MTGKLSHAIALAADIHADQYDKGGEPYILHPVRVMEDAMRVGDGYERYGIIAVLHDALEDNKKYTDEMLRSMIAERFGEDNLGDLDLLTKRRGDSYLDDYIPRIIQAKENAHPAPLVVKMADLRDNMNIRRQPTLREKDLERIQKYHRAYQMLREAA
jgi:GTP diphosphokinase / guanosine-3',5'-bis(diphosphate) 3'-diphosphatase